LLSKIAPQRFGLVALTAMVVFTASTLTRIVLFAMSDVGHTGAIAVARAITRGAGYRIARGATDTFVTRLATLDLPTAMRESLVPVHHVMEVLDEELAKADAHFAALTADNPVVKRLTTCPSIGPITAAAFVAALDDVRRFAGRRGAGQVTSYLGLAARV
jgi:transposase